MMRLCVVVVGLLNFWIFRFGMNEHWVEWLIFNFFVDLSDEDDKVYEDDEKKRREGDDIKF